MNSGTLMTILPLVLLIVIMYFLLIRPQKKREKQVTAMRNAIKVGDQVITIGGIKGKIVKTKDEVLTIQVGSGADKMKFDIMRWSISKVDEPGDAPVTKAVEEEEEEAPKKKAPKRMTKKSEDPAEADDKEEDEEKKPAKPKKIKKSEE